MNRKDDQPHERSTMGEEEGMEGGGGDGEGGRGSDLPLNMSTASSLNGKRSTLIAFIF